MQCNRSVMPRKYMGTCNCQELLWVTILSGSQSAPHSTLHSTRLVCIHLHTIRAEDSHVPQYTMVIYTHLVPAHVDTQPGRGTDMNQRLIGSTLQIHPNCV
jgi:hypothetical protein